MARALSVVRRCRRDMATMGRRRWVVIRRQNLRRRVARWRGGRCRGRRGRHGVRYRVRRRQRGGRYRWRRGGRCGVRRGEGTLSLRKDPRQIAFLGNARKLFLGSV
eukprot:gene7810-biopygen21082